jgi:hypothetical protein
VIKIEQSSFDRYNVTPQLMELINRLARSHVSRYPIEAVVGDPRSVWFIDSRAEGVNLSVYRSIKHAICRVTLGAGADSNDKFRVFSYRINNERYRTGTDNYNSQVTKSADKAFDLLRSVAVNDPIEKLFGLTFQDKEQAHNKWKRDAEQDYQKKLMNLSFGGIGIPTLSALIREREARGDFLDETLNKITTPDIVEAHREFLKRRNAAGLETCVYVDPATNMCDWAVADDMPIKPDKLMKQCAFDALPVPTQERVAMLRMMAINEYVAGVGYRSSNHIYWTY